MSKHLFGAKFDSLGQLADKIIYNIGNFLDIPILIFLQFFLFLFLMFSIIFTNMQLDLYIRLMF